MSNVVKNLLKFTGSIKERVPIFLGWSFDDDGDDNQGPIFLGWSLDDGFDNNQDPIFLGWSFDDDSDDNQEKWRTRTVEEELNREIKPYT